MSPRRNPRFAFTLAVLLLVLSGVSVMFILLRMSRIDRRIAHNYEVQLTLANMDSAIARGAHASEDYFAAARPADQSELTVATALLQQHLVHLQSLVQGQSPQMESFQHIRRLSHQWLELIEKAVEQKQTGETPSQDIEAVLDAESADLEARVREMGAYEQVLLAQRRDAFGGLFLAMLAILAVVFLLSLGLLWFHHRRLASELHERLIAEQTAIETQEVLRRLSGRLLRLQDEERRRFSRELHDSLGQYLAVVKMNLDSFARTHPRDPLIEDAVMYLEQSIAETRTISHLLHPPLLDEVGFASAARWYVEGFAQRSGLLVNTDIPANLERVPRGVELALFRVLQEGLTNIHRHSKSSRADVALRQFANRVVLRIRDYGQGMAPEVLQRFGVAGPAAGVGLVGMRERIREQGGELDIQSDSTGTILTVTLPFLPGALEQEASEPGRSEEAPPPGIPAAAAARPSQPY